VTEHWPSGPRDENDVAGWLAQALRARLVSVGIVYLRARKYAVEFVYEDDDESPLVLTRVHDGRRFEVSIEVEAVELPNGN